MYEKVSDAEQMAASVPDSSGTFFVPAFNGLQVQHIVIFLQLFCAKTTTF